jgi:hypothetical protein
MMLPPATHGWQNPGTVPGLVQELDAAPPAATLGSGVRDVVLFRQAGVKISDLERSFAIARTPGLVAGVQVGRCDLLPGGGDQDIR